MEIKETVKLIEQKVFTYIANDGTEFLSESECREHEKNLELKTFIEGAEKLRVKELDDVIPISTEAIINDNTFLWYKLNNKQDFEILNKAYNNSLYEPSVYPMFKCVENSYYNPYDSDYYYDYDLCECKNITENFWNKFGYKVIFEKL